MRGQVGTLALLYQVFENRPR